MDDINPYQAPPESIDEFTDYSPPLDPHSIQYASRWLRLGVGVFFALNVVLIYTRGQTVGKLICGTVVVNSNNFRQVSGNRYIFLRIIPMSLLGNIPGVGGLIDLADSLAIFRAEKNCLHNDIASTRVIMRKDLTRLQL